MLYTTIPIPKQQLSSDSFRTRKIGDEFPAPVFESRVSIMSAHTSMKISIFFQYLWAYTASRLLEKTIPITTFLNALSSTRNIETFIPTPSLIVTFREYNETINNVLSELGFSKQSSGRYKYAKGPSSDGAITRLLKEGASADAYSMMGSCNITGYTCFTIINRLLHAALPFLCLSEEDLPELWKMSTVDDKIAKEYVVKSSTNLPENGILFPYFDGMILPEKANVPRIILHLFSKCMGKTPSELMTAARIIQDGWPSLSTTTTGLVISHIVFGISLALSGASIHVITIGGVYNGFILSGSKFTCFKGKQEHKILVQEKLREEFEALDEHDAAILDLSEIISTAPLYETEDQRVVLPEHLQTPRRIHYAIRLRKFNSLEVSRISKLVLKLHFRQNFWDRANNTHILKAVGSLLAKELLPVEAPYALNSGTLFSQSHIISALAAFGEKSISLCGPGMGNTTVSLFSKKGKAYESLDNVKLEGVPLFFKPLSECVSDWETVLKTGVVTMKTGIKTKKGDSKVAGLGTYVMAASDEYGRLCSLLSKHIVSQAGSKRKDRDSKEGADGLENEPSAQALKKRKEGNMDLLGLLGAGPVLPEGEHEEAGSMDTFDPFA